MIEVSTCATVGDHRRARHRRGPGAKVLAVVESGDPINEIQRAYEQATTKWQVFGVPTFIVEDRAVFVRLMSRPDGDAALARRSIEGVVALMDEQPDLNEFKYTTLSRERRAPRAQRSRPAMTIGRSRRGVRCCASAPHSIQ